MNQRRGMGDHTVQNRSVLIKEYNNYTSPKKLLKITCRTMTSVRNTLLISLGNIIVSYRKVMFRNRSTVFITVISFSSLQTFSLVRMFFIPLSMSNL